MPTKTQLPWSDIRKRVLKLLETLTVTTSKQIGPEETVTTRPLRFVEFSRAVGIDNGKLHHVIRNNMPPTATIEAAVREWVSKQEEP